MKSKPTSLAASAKKKSPPKAGKTSRKTVVGAVPVPVAERAHEKAPSPPRKRTSKKSTTAFAIGPEERHHLIQVSAYYIAERRGFHGESAHEDWRQAEQEINALIAAGKLAG
jgi:hypothetical protein